MTNRLYRSRSERMMGGVCGGLGAYFGIDPVLVRLLFVILTVWGGAGVLIYLVLWVIIPVEGRAGIASGQGVRENVAEIEQEARKLAEQAEAAVRGQPTEAAPSRVPADRTVLAAVGLIALGGLMLIANLTPFNFGQLWPALLVLLGIYLIYNTVTRR